MPTQVITCQQCKCVIGEREAIFAVRINKFVQALCEACIKKIPRRGKISEEKMAGRSSMLNPNLVGIHQAMRNLRKGRLELCDKRFTTTTRIFKECLPNISFNGREA